MSNEIATETEKGKNLDLKRFFSSRLKNQTIDIVLGESFSKKSIISEFKYKTKRAVRKIMQNTLYLPAKFIRNFMNKTVEAKVAQCQQEILRKMEMQHLELLQSQQQILASSNNTNHILNHLNRKFVIFEKENKVLINTIMGYLFCSLDDVPIMLCLIDSGELERGTRIFIRRFLIPGNTYVDIGANYGMHVLAAYHALKGEGKIISFEPFAKTFQLLKETVNLNQLLASKAIIELHQLAISNEAGSEKLYLGSVSGHHSLYPLTHAQDTNENTAIIDKVRLDDIIPIDVSIDLMKIDVEGAELDVIEGAKQTIQNNPNMAIIIEFGPSHIHRIGKTIQEWMGKFNQLDLIYKVINEANGNLETWTMEDLSKTHSVNLVFAKRNAKVWEKL